MLHTIFLNVFYFHYLSLIACFVFTYLFGDFQNSRNSTLKKGYKLLIIVFCITLFFNILEFALLAYQLITKHDSLIVDGYIFTIFSLTFVELFFAIYFFNYKYFVRLISAIFTKQG